MSRMKRAVLVLAAAAAALALAAPAQAGLLVASAPNCSDGDWTNPFMPWLDPANYVLAPGGTAESADGWTFSGDAAIVDGNESFQVTSADDARSVSLPAGSSATTGVMCVGLEHPTLRHFVKRNGGGLLASLQVEVLFEDAAGNVRDLTIGSVGGSGQWQPTAPMVVTASLLPLLPGSHTPVAFRFTARGGSFQIDDVYVDPYVRH